MMIEALPEWFAVLFLTVNVLGLCALGLDLRDD
jgi:hypothetical protein